MKSLTIDTQQGCLELATELTHGPRLFDDLGQPTEAVTRYTGDRVTQDLERCVMAGALRLLGCSDREISKACGCDTRSIPLMLDAAEKAGRIPALKDRLVKLTGHNAERAQIALADMLNRASNGHVTAELAAMIKAVATAGGINTTNLQLLTGAATEIVEVRAGAGRAEIEAWWREMAVDVTPKDGQSPETDRNPQQSGHPLAVTRLDDTAGAALGGDDGAGPASAADPRGGGATGRGAGESDRLTGLQNLGKGAS